jgi:hypothetical protein
MTEIVTPFAQFFDTNGAPLNNGAIFIGTAYLDAQTNPIPVFWDDAFTIPAAQPIRTLNGYAVRNGAPARIFCNADNFSMTVQTSTGRTVWSVQDATSESKTSDIIFQDFAAPTGSSLVGFIQSGASAAARTVQDKFRDTVSVKDFGAVGDGVTVDTAAFQAAVNTGKRVFIPNGNYIISASINITNPVFIDAESRQAIITLPAASSFDLFRIASNNVFFRNFLVQGNGTQTGSIFKLRSSVGSFEMFSFESIEAKQCHHFLTDDNSTGVLTLCYLDSCFHRQPTGSGIDLNDMFAFFFVDKFTVDYVGVTAPSSNTPGIRQRNGQGSRYSNVDVLGGTIGGFGNRRGIDIQNSEAIWLDRVMADTMGGEGIYLKNCTGLYLSKVTGSLCDLHQIVIEACVNVIGLNLYAAGRAALGGTAAQDGLRVSGGSTSAVLSNIFTSSNTQHGLHLVGAGTSATITGLNSRNNTGRGFRCAGLSSMTTGSQLASNTAGNYDLVGTFDHAMGIQLNSGALVVNATGPVVA